MSSKYKEDITKRLDEMTSMYENIGVNDKRVQYNELYNNLATHLYEEVIGLSKTQELTEYEYGLIMSYYFLLEEMYELEQETIADAIVKNRNEKLWGE